MAKKPAAKVTKTVGQPQKVKGKRKTLSVIITWVIAPLVGILAFPTVMLSIGGMLPTLVAYIIDRTGKKHATYTVGYMNGVGCMAVALKMWLGDHSIDKALELMGDPMNWLIMYGAASVGWVIYFVMPPIVGTYLSISQEVKLKQLHDRQQELINEWGTDVKKDAPPLESLEDDQDDEEGAARASRNVQYDLGDDMAEGEYTDGDIGNVDEDNR